MAVQQTAVEKAKEVAERDLMRAIRRNVLRRLGVPKNGFDRVEVHPLFAVFWRVNVVTRDAKGPHIPHSYYVRASAEGHIEWSDPEIAKVYGLS